MASTVLEQTRALHEDIEILEKTMYGELGDVAAAKLKRADEVARDQVVATLRNAHTSKCVELTALYEDADGATTRRPQALVVRCTAPTWMPLSTVDLWGPGGARLASFPAEHPAPPQVHAVVEPPDATWVVATCAGDTSAPPMLDDAPWAVSSPVWLERP